MFYIKNEINGQYGIVDTIDCTLDYLSKSLVDKFTNNVLAPKIVSINELPKDVLASANLKYVALLKSALRNETLPYFTTRYSLPALDVQTNGVLNFIECVNILNYTTNCGAEFIILGACNVETGAMYNVILKLVFNKEFSYLLVPDEYRLGKTYPAGSGFMFKNMMKNDKVKNMLGDSILYARFRNNDKTLFVNLETLRILDLEEG